MTSNFNTKVSDAKRNIQKECKLFHESFKTFIGVGNLITTGSDINQDTVKHCKEFINDLNEGHFKLLFCGRVKSGKSRCIIEFLEGELHLPSSGTPTTTFCTQISFSNEPRLFSKTSADVIKNYEFDGKCVKNEFVGRVDVLPDENTDMETIFYVETPNTLKENSFIIIDSPGLDETKQISESFFKNLNKINPQLVIYIYDSGPGFTVDDKSYWTRVISNTQKYLKKIILFNKYDVAFNIEPAFDSSDDDNERSADSASESNSDDDEIQTDPSHVEKYNHDYERHWNYIQSFSSEENKLILFGYSSRLVQKMRVNKENELPFLLYKHIDFLNEIQRQINIVNIEVIQNALIFTEEYIFTKFKMIYDQILGAKEKDYSRVRLGSTARDRLLLKFDQTHRDIKIQLSKNNQFELESTISEMIKNQLKQFKDDVPKEEKLQKVSNGLIKFLINRHRNLFSNIIHETVDNTSFNNLTDEIKSNDLVGLFPHAFCTLKHGTESENLSLVIENYLTDQYNKFVRKMKKIPFKDLQTVDNYKQFIKSNMKYDINSVLPKVEDFLRIKLSNEKKQLENAITIKANEVTDSLKMTEQEINTKIQESIVFFRTWLLLNNKLIIAQSNNFRLTKQKKDFLLGVIDNTVTMNTAFSYCPDDSTVCIKEPLDLTNINCQNCQIIQYFLRSQFISQYLLKRHLYFHESVKEVYFLTDTHDYKPLSVILTQLSSGQKVSIISKLIDIIERLHDCLLPIENFGPDMIFCKIISDEKVDIRISETVQLFNEWKLTFGHENHCDFSFLKYPYHDKMSSTKESVLSMCYSFTWTLLIVFCGTYCSQMSNCSDIKKNSRESFILLNETPYKNVSTELKTMLDKCLKRPFEVNLVTDVFRIISDLRERLGCQ